MKATRILVGAAFVVASSGAFAQASISQGKTATFPITISQPGSYKLTSNLVVPANTHGIVITAPNVTLDLNGFTISGPMTCPNMQPAGAVCLNGGAATARGIDLVAGNATVRNGTVRGFSRVGIYVQQGGNRLSDLVLEHNFDGISSMTVGTASHVTRVLAQRNAHHGVVMDKVQVESSSAMQNGGNGIHLVGSSQAVDTMSSRNRGAGFMANGYIVLRGTNANQNSTGNYAGDAKSGGGNIDNGLVF